MRRIRRPSRSRSPLVVVALSLVLGIVPDPSHAIDGATLEWFRIPAREAGSLGPIAADRVIDYGTYLWVGVHRSLATSLETESRRAIDFSLTLGGQRSDPLDGAPDLPARWRSTDDRERLSLVQLVGPTRAEWLRRLEDRGLEVVQYVHPFTYVVWGPAPDVTALDEVRWSGRFEPAYKVLPPWRSLDDTPVRMSGLVLRQADPEAVVAELEILGATDVRMAAIDPVFRQVKLTMPGDRMAQAAAIPGVYTLKLQPTDGGLRGEMSDQINVNNHDGSNRAFSGYQTWLAGVGLDGSGVVMANVDLGIQDDHPDLVARLTGCSGDTCGGSASSDHGTHTAGIMAADGSSGQGDGNGFLRGLGVAPGATLVEQLYDPPGLDPPWYTQPGGMLKLMEESRENGAILSGNSWGPAGAPQGYDDDTRQVDVGVRDADDDVPGDQAFTYVLSIMNGRGGTSTQGSPDEAKNIFTIGSTKMQKPDGTQILDVDDLSWNTAHGPALDGRKIPHMVAPGCEIDSTVGNNGYDTNCGTSMASPHVSGAIALFVERYRERMNGDPSPALVKAAFLPVAHDLAGNDDADGSSLGHPIDSKQGWGRMDLEAVVDPKVEVASWDGPRLLDESGELWAVDTEIVDGGEPVRIMLVWTDAPGHGLGGSTPAWNNDLDLVVEHGGQIYRGNDFGFDGFSKAGSTTADGKNNTEGVFLPAGTSGTVTLRVEAANITSDGVPSLGDDTDQDFALVCYNCRSDLIFADHFEDGSMDRWIFGTEE